MSLWDTLPHTFNAHRRRTTPGKFGDEQDTEYAVLTGIECWVQPASAREVVEFQRQDMVVTHKLYVRTEQALLPGDLLTITKGPYAGKRYNFRSQVECTAGLAVGWKIMVENLR